MPGGRVNRPRYTENDCLEIFRLKKDGKSNREIGKLMGRTAASIQGKINHYRESHRV